MRNDFDELLKRVLTPSDEPGDILNWKIIAQVKENKNMKQKKKKISAAVIAATLAATTSITAFAAWRYLDAADVADRLGEENVAKSFVEESVTPNENAEDTENNAAEKQSYGGYQVTMLGLASGDSLSENPRISNGEVRSDRTYCVVMIQREDGTAIDEEQENYFVSPLIKGLNPGLYNIVSMAGNYSEFVEDGVLYRLIECDNIAYFADRTIYLCVTDTSFYDSTLYHYNEDGSITRNEEYPGLNALFTLKMDASLADPVKAQELIDRINSPEEDDTEIEVPPEAAKAMEWGSQITPENIEQFCDRLENTVQTMTADKDGYLTLQPWVIDEVNGSGGGSGGKFLMSFLFEDRTPGLYIDGYSASENGLKDFVITTFTLNEDGTVTFAAWVPKESYRQ